MPPDPSSPILRGLDPRGVATLTFNRPEVNNAYDGELIAAALGAMDALAKETALRVVVLRGAGKHFQAGADLKWMRSLGARRIGLVHEVVPLAGLEAAGERVVDHLLQNAPEANRQTKAAAFEFAWGKMSEETFANLVAQHSARRQSEEAAEGLASFAEKRAARWYS